MTNPQLGALAVSTAGDAVQDPAMSSPAVSAATTFRGAGWTIGWRLATRVIGLGSTLVLVRLLTPSDFGLVSLAAGLIASMDGFIAFGVDGAIIRSDVASREIYDAGFTINVVRAAATSGVLALGAVPLARFFDTPALAYVIYALAAGWAISGFQNVGMVEYRRVMAFDMEFKAKIIPRLLSLAVTIPVAAIWHSYWALIGGILANQIIGVLVSYALHPYRPRFGTAGMRHIFSFSFWEWLICLAGLIGGRADTVIIGRLLNTAAVGVYGVGGEIASLPSGEIVAPLCRALFSSFVAERRGGGAGTDSVLQMLGLLAVFIFPLSVGLSLVAYPVTELCFGAEWLGAVPLIQVLAIAGTVNLIGSVGEALFSASAWLRTILSTTVAVTVVRLLLLAVLIPNYGLLGGALASAAVTCVQETIYLVIAKRRLGITVASIFARLARPAGAVCCMAAVLWATGLGWTDTPAGSTGLILHLAAAVSLGAAVYVSALGLIWLAAGRPNGPETEVMGLIRRITRRA